MWSPSTIDQPVACFGWVQSPTQFQTRFSAWHCVCAGGQIEAEEDGNVCPVADKRDKILGSRLLSVIGDTLGLPDVGLARCRRHSFSRAPYSIPIATKRMASC